MKKICRFSAEFSASSDSYTNAKPMMVSNLKLSVTFSYSVGPATRRALGHHHYLWPEDMASASQVVKEILEARKTE